jgi:hypothetical protein
MKRPFWFCTHCRQIVRVDDRGTAKFHVDARAAERALNFAGPSSSGVVCEGAWTPAKVVSIDFDPLDWKQPE